MDAIGDRWSVLILREAYSGVKRFDEFQCYVGLASNILSGRLKKLVVAGILARVPLPEHAGRFEYALTEKGRDFSPTYLALKKNGAMTGWLSRRDRKLSLPNVELDAKSSIPSFRRPAANRSVSRMLKSSRGPASCPSTARGLARSQT